MGETPPPLSTYLCLCAVYPFWEEEEEEEEEEEKEEEVPNGVSWVEKAKKSLKNIPALTKQLRPFPSLKKNQEEER